MIKALILAAGLGTRLRPYTDHIPKPLFPINGKPLLDRLILQLKAAGCGEIAVNTHHLHDKIAGHIAAQSYGIPIITRHEPDILGTGGAIKNLADFWNDRPFLVVNADILTDIDFGDVYRSHCGHNAPATLVLTDAPGLNSVTLGPNQTISGFLSSPRTSSGPNEKVYTFTGIQVLNPEILSRIPENAFYSSIDAYRQLITEGTPPAAYIAASKRWQDLGTPDRYKTAARDALTDGAFRQAFGHSPAGTVKWQHLDGDGSDRRWYRFRSGEQSLVAADHGLKSTPKPSEIDSFVAIGRYLEGCMIPVPRIYRFDLFSGWVFMEDVGDTHLQTIVRQSEDPDAAALYRRILDILIRFSMDGIQGFDSNWTCQSAAYDRPLILERECAYFVDAFLNGYLGLDVSVRDFASDFDVLAEGALSGAFTGLMHRDFQSRNIMIHLGQPRIIDFQGARRGPLQYDIASLLIDPYTELSEPLQDELFEYALSRISEKTDVTPDRFKRCYACCRITRNLQMLGAFGHLTRVKGKLHFERYIPAALRTLKRNLSKLELPGVSRLKKAVDNLKI